MMMMVSLLPSLLHAVAAQHSPNRLPPDFASHHRLLLAHAMAGRAAAWRTIRPNRALCTRPFDVPELPKKQDDICFYIYFNIFFRGKGHGTMNQFVPQLMLGNSLARRRVRLSIRPSGLSINRGSSRRSILWRLTTPRREIRVRRMRPPVRPTR